MPIYMKFEGIKGSVTALNYQGWIELESCQLGVHRSITSPHGQGREREPSTPSVQEIVITKFQDSASTDLFREALNGKGRKVTIDFVKSGENIPYLSIELENVLISNYSVSGHGGDVHDRPLESLSLNFTKITFSTKQTVPPANPKHTMLKTLWQLQLERYA